VLERHAEPLLVESYRLVEVIDGDAYVIDPSEHGGKQNTQMAINIENPDFDEPREQEGFRARRARISRQAGAERLGASLWEVEPGQAAYPYHFHYGEEELIVVLSGTPTLRGPSGERELEQGEVVAFLTGERGAHQLINRSDRPVRFLALSPSGPPDVVVYPDSGKIAFYERRPDGGGLRELHLRANAVDYYEGESAPG
jgi:uncharacterized cupin superfamily protein